MTHSYDPLSEPMWSEVCASEPYETLRIRATRLRELRAANVSPAVEAATLSEFFEAVTRYGAEYRRIARKYEPGRG